MDSKPVPSADSTRGRVAAAWLNALELCPDLGVLELQAMLIARRENSTAREWRRIRAAVGRLVRTPTLRQAALAHLLQVARGAAR